MARKLRAVGYTRVSTAEQATDEKVSLTEQENDIQEHCQRKGHDLGRIYQDAGFSGASKNRPAFQEMLRDARAGAFDVIVCWKSDRLSRGLYPAAPLLEAVEGTGITLESVKDSIDLNTFSILAAVGKIQLSDMSHRARMGHQGNAKKGKVISPPFGYCLDEEGRPVIDTDHAEVVRRIFNMYTREGASCQRIADTLNGEGMVTRRDCRWSKQTVAIIIGNSAYVGKGQWGRRHVYKKDNGRGRDVKHVQWTPRDTWIDVPFPAIIDSHTFQEAQRRKKHYTIERVGRMEGLSFPLKGILFCAQHQKNYTASYTANKGERNVYRYYECTAGSRFHKEYGKCYLRKPSAEDMDHDAHVWVLRHLLEPDNLERIRDNFIKKLRDGGGLEIIDKAKERLRELEEEKARVMVSYEKGWRTEGEVELRLRVIAEEQEYYQEELDRTEAEFGELRSQVEILESLGSKEQRRAAWKNAFGYGRDQLIKTVLKQMTIKEDGDVEYRVNLDAVAELSKPRRCS